MDYVLELMDKGMKQRICSPMITSLCQSDYYGIFFYSNLRDAAVFLLEILLESLYVQLYVE